MDASAMGASAEAAASKKKQRARENEVLTGNFREVRCALTLTMRLS
jgi:hypothetical protein|tara:strand:- start:502 stop:639 length:138 start_codon:yes stop_codon:yes gene_type:complete